MPHFNDTAPSGPIWWLRKAEFTPRESWPNISKDNLRCVEVLLPVAPYWFISPQGQPASNILRPSEYGDPIKFKVDTGATVTVFKGPLADELYNYCDQKARGTIRTAADEPYNIATGVLALFVCGRWIGVKCAFFLTTMDKRYMGLQNEALLGMTGLLWAHMLSVTTEGVDVLRRVHRLDLRTPPSVSVQSVDVSRGHSLGYFGKIEDLLSGATER